MGASSKPPPVLYVDVDLTDNVPAAPPPEFQQLEGREHLIYAARDGRVLLVPQAPLRAPSSWGVL